MLVQQQDLRLGEGSHQQAQRLPLPAGEHADLGSQTVLQTDAQTAQLFTEHIAFGRVDAKG
ncbi:hypothetical protein D3C76_1853840 [compost metagenome]